MKKTIAIILAVMLVACLAASALAEGWVHTTGSVNLRSGPGLGYKKLYAVKAGVTLDYLGETSTDDRGIDWYLVDYSGDACWISSVYSWLEDYDDVDTLAPDLDFDPAAVSGYLEISDYYMIDLDQAAATLGLPDYRYEENSEVPRQFSNGALTAAGYSVAECFSLTGQGFTIFGAHIGMDANTAKQLLLNAGLRFDGAYDWGMIFEHPVFERSALDIDGVDSCINIEVSNGVVTGMDWSTYTG